jgi:hypothetical protein
MNNLAKITIGVGITALMTVTYSQFGQRKLSTTEVNGVQWLNSYEAAVEESKRTGKPILFLSMFGRIDEKMPCANARTLRATLFKSEEFKKFAQNEVIPAWEMVRKVPKVTVDLGDGEKIVRTVRGNAVMYLCTPQGKAFDAFPGIYTERDFFPMVRRSIKQLYEKVPYQRDLNDPEVLRLTMSKSAVESPVLDLMGAKKMSGATTSVDPNNQQLRRFRSAAKLVEDVSLTPTPSKDLPVLLGFPAGYKPTAEQILAVDSRNNSIKLRPIVRMYFDSLKELPTPYEARDYILQDLLKIPYKDPYFGLKDVLLPGTD